VIKKVSLMRASAEIEPLSPAIVTCRNANPFSQSV
jgi:hypothetical protein